MEKIIEIRDTKYNDAYIGYIDDMVSWLKHVLVDEIRQNGDEIDQIWPYVITAIMVINSLETRVEDYKNKMVIVWNVMYDGMGWEFLDFDIKKYED